MDYRPLLARHAAPLTHDQAEWEKAAEATGLTPYECKASYIFGVMRELMQASGLTLKGEYHLGSLFLALNATELLGRTISGARRNGDRKLGATEVLRRGLTYLEDHADPEVEALRLTPADYAHLRNFAGHGATYLPAGNQFDPDSTRLLLLHLVHVLNTMCDDADLPASLAAVEVHPIWSLVNGKSQPVYVQAIQSHLAENLPGDRLAHEDSWRYTDASLDASSPAVSGRP